PSGSGSVMGGEREGTARSIVVLVLPKCVDSPFAQHVQLNGENADDLLNVHTFGLAERPARVAFGIQALDQHDAFQSGPTWQQLGHSKPVAQDLANRLSVVNRHDP